MRKPRIAWRNQCGVSRNRRHLPQSRLHQARATALLVEDDALIRINTAEILQDAGLIVVEAGSAEEAKAALQTMAVDVLVTDVNLPGASGSELAAEARALRPATLIIYATGDPSSVRDEADAIVVAKPYDAEKLAEAISKAGIEKFTEAHLDRVQGMTNWMRPRCRPDIEPDRAEARELRDRHKVLSLLRSHLLEQLR